MLDTTFVMNIKEARLREADEAKALDSDERVERNEAMVEYVAMMCDIELPEVDE